MAVTICGLFLFPPTESFAANNWLEKKLEKVFSGPRKKAQNKRRSKPAKESGNIIILPATAPLPEPAARTLTEAGASDPEDGPMQDAPDKEFAQEAREPSSVAPEPRTESRTPEDIELPETMSLPQQEPARTPSGTDLPEKNAPAPVDIPNDTKTAPLDEIPAEPPKPEFRPDKSDPGKPNSVQAGESKEPPPPDPRSGASPDPSGKLPEAELACRLRLADLGVEFRESKAKSDPSGCSMPYPIVVKSLGRNFDISPAAEMNCATAETTARFARDVISPAAKSVFDTALKSISHASAYVCRPRNGTTKLSEHAFGNALDIAAFTLSDGIIIAVEPDPPEKNLRFLSKVRTAACGPFKTVLGPGSNADHAEHLHFDLAPRRNGGTVCE